MSGVKDESTTGLENGTRASVDTTRDNRTHSITSHTSHNGTHSSQTSSSHAGDEDDDEAASNLERFSTHHSMGPDTPLEPSNSIMEIPDEFYDKLSPGRKRLITSLLSFSSLLAPMSSTSVLAATPEVAATYHTTGTIINLVNALYMLFMGISPVVWGPLSQVYGRRAITLVTGVGFLACSIGTALSPNLAAFWIFRILTAFEGTSYLLTGSAVISDIYRPVERGTAMGLFFAGTLIGPAFGPFIGGIIVTYQSWRVIFWLQTGLAALVLIGAWFLLPETIYHKRIDDLVGHSGKQKARELWVLINPWRVLRLYEYPNLLLVGMSSSSLVWNMYSLLTPIRYVLNPRYNLSSPMEGGLFYLAPGCGYLLGTFMGGRYADFIVRRYIKKRGVRIAEDRLISALPFMCVIAACMLVYGWCVEMDVGGIPVTVIVMFIQGVAQLFCFPSLNTYCLDVMAGRSGEVIAGNYAMRYLFAFIGMSVVLPAVEKIGIGWFSTISAAFVLSGGGTALLTIKFGKGWRDRIDAKKKRAAKKSLAERAENSLAAEANGAVVEHSPRGQNNNNNNSNSSSSSAPRGSGNNNNNSNTATLDRDVEKEAAAVAAGTPQQAASPQSSATGQGQSPPPKEKEEV